MREPHGHRAGDLYLHKVVSLGKKLLSVNAASQIKILAPPKDMAVKGYTQILILFRKHRRALIGYEHCGANVSVILHTDCARYRCGEKIIEKDEGLG